MQEEGEKIKKDTFKDSQSFYAISKPKNKDQYNENCGAAKT